MPDKAAPGDKYAGMVVYMDRNDCADKDNKHHFGTHCTKKVGGGSRRYPNGIQGNNNVSVQGNRISEGI